MKVKVGNKVYDGEKQIVMVILDDLDKSILRQVLDTDEKKYVAYPANIKMSYEEILNWMSDSSKKSYAKPSVVFNPVKTSLYRQKMNERLSVYDLTDIDGKNKDSVVINSPSLSTVKKVIESVGSKIGSVTFIKRTTGEIREMQYKLHVSNPKYAKTPNEKPNYKGGFLRDKNGRFAKNISKRQKEINEENSQIVVFDVNKIEYKNGEKIRGAYRTIPLENVEKVSAGNIVYSFLRN